MLVKVIYIYIYIYIYIKSINFPYNGKAHQNQSLREPWNIDTHTDFRQSMATFLSLNSHPILWTFPWISHSMENSSKIRPNKRDWGFGTHMTPKLWVFLFHQIPIIWIIARFSKEFFRLRVISAKAIYHMEISWNVNTHTFGKIWFVSLPSSSHLIGY